VQASQVHTTTSVYDTGNRLVAQLYGGSGQTPLREDFTYTPSHQISTTTRYSSLDDSTKVTCASYANEKENRATNLEQSSIGRIALSKPTYTVTLPRSSHLFVGGSCPPRDVSGSVGVYGSRGVHVLGKNGQKAAFSTLQHAGPGVGWSSNSRRVTAFQPALHP
jgi:hypothetical protein